MSHHDAESSESEWQAIFMPKHLVCDGPIANVKKITKHLRQVFPDDQVEIQVQFETYSLLQKFQKKLELEYEIYRPEQMIVEHNDWDTIWKEIYTESKLKKIPNMDKMKVYKIIFRNPLEFTVFYFNYGKILKRLEKEYNYIMLPERKRLIVYLKDKHDKKINSFFVTEMIDMKNKLNYRVESSPEIYNKVRYSKMAVQKLEKMKIKTMIMSRYESAVFYSDQFQNSYDIMKEVNKILTYHTSVIKFPDHFVNKYILKEIMRLIYFEIKPALKEIERYFDMPVEVDIEKAAIVITDFHPVFTDGVDLVRENLQKLKILEIECDSLVQLKQIMQKAQYSPLVRFNYRYRKCFLLFSDTVTEKNLKTMVNFCEQISVFFKAYYKIVVHFTHLFQDQNKLRSETERVRCIAAECHLNNVMHSIFSIYSDFDKIAFEPVQLSVYAEDMRKKQVRKFFIDFVTNRKAEFKKVDYTIFDSSNIDDSLLHECHDEKSALQDSEKPIFENHESTQSQQEHRKNRNIHKRPVSIQTFDSSSVDKSEFIQLSIPFEYPKSADFEQNVPLKAGKRDGRMQTLMEKLFKRKLRVWKVIIHSSIKLSSMKSYDKIEIIDSQMFEMKDSSYKLKKYNKVTIKKVKDFKEGEKGYISFVNHQKNAIVPIHKVQFVSP